MHVMHQQGLWPAPHQLALPEQLMLPEPPSDRAGARDRIPDEVEPVGPPAAAAALACVTEVVEHAARVLRIAPPRIRWFIQRLRAEPDGTWHILRGFYVPGETVIWLDVAYECPQTLAETVAHEVVHYWQELRHGPSVDAEEDAWREREARRRARLLVPKGTYRMPRGKERHPWFEDLTPP